MYHILKAVFKNKIRYIGLQKDAWKVLNKVYLQLLYINYFKIK